MNPERISAQLSHTTWLKLFIFFMLLLAIGSAAVLYSRSSLWNLPAAAAVQHDDTSIFVAPPGILDSEAKFAPVGQYDDAPPPAPAKLPDPVAPARLLDPEWQISFGGIATK